MIRKISAFVKNYLLERKAYQFFIRDWMALSDLSKAGDVLATMRFSQNLQPLQSDGPNAKRLLVIAPHPDDETIGPGGTLLRAIQNGANVLTVYLSCGTPETSDTLKTEAQHIATQHGYKTVFLNYYSKNIPINDAVVLRLSEIINNFAPDAMFLPFLLDDHDDHRRASHLIMLAHDKRLLKNDFNIWAYQVYTVLPSNIIVDITDVAQDKEKLIQGWKTQNKTRNWAHYALGLNAFNQRFLPNGPGAKYAEGFFVLPLKEYIQLCHHYFKNPADCYYHSDYKNPATST